MPRRDAALLIPRDLGSSATAVGTLSNIGGREDLSSGIPHCLQSVSGSSGHSRLIMGEKHHHQLQSWTGQGPSSGTRHGGEGGGGGGGLGLMPGEESGARQQGPAPGLDSGLCLVFS